MLESLLFKIASAIFKKVALGGLIKTAAAAYEIYSVIDAVSDISYTVDTVNDCSDLSVFGVKVASNSLSEVAFNKIIQLNSHSFQVEKTKSGIYIASSMLPRFAANSLNFPTFEKRSFSDLSNKKLKKPSW